MAHLRLIGLEEVASQTYRAGIAMGIAQAIVAEQAKDATPIWLEINGLLRRDALDDQIKSAREAFERNPTEQTERFLVAMIRERLLLVDHDQQ